MKLKLTMIFALVAGATAAEDRAPEDQTPTGKFTTAGEIKMILDATQGNWVAVREFDGQDLVYFTHLLSWRCGLWDINYGLNGDPAETVLEIEPCYEDTATPNALKVEDILPYIAQPLGSVDSVSIQIDYDDGTSGTAEFDRAAIQIQ